MFQNIIKIIEIKWCDNTLFDNIQVLTELSERHYLNYAKNQKQFRFCFWRECVSGKIEKHKKRKSMVRGWMFYGSKEIYE